MIMRRLAQFVSLCASARVCVRLCASVSRLLMLRVPNARVCVSRRSRVCVRLSRVCVSRLSQFVRLLASASGSVCASVSRVGLASVCVCSRLCASARVCVRRSRVCVRLLASVCVCLASVCVCSRLCASASVSVRASACVCVRLLVNACGNWLILCVSRHSKSLKVGELAQVFAICLASYYPLVFYLIMSQC